jgi:polysaccharide pyruvyl transferase WcaK-like protein
MKILILNSDSPNNRGDRAILAGNIELLKSAYPDAQITSLSQFKERDEAWFGINFLKLSPYSIKPADYLTLLAEARKSDIIFWGGGEILKDYTNKISLFYWALKLFGIRVVNKNIIGAFQGIGPTKANVSKKVIAFAVSQCRAFLTRDEESKAKLEAWGVRIPIIASYDPAIFEQAKPVTPQALKNFTETQGIPVEVLNNYIGFGVRRWFHYRASSWLPASLKPWQKATVENSDELNLYVSNLAQIADNLVEAHDANIVFFPMHVSASENDQGFAGEVIARMKHADRAYLISKDNLAPAEMVSVLSMARAFMASRLHSAILASVANVPAYCLYYVDKGRIFFEQMGLAKHSAAIATILNDGAVETLTKEINLLIANSAKVKVEMNERLGQMRNEIERDLQQAVNG